MDLGFCVCSLLCVDKIKHAKHFSNAASIISYATIDGDRLGGFFGRQRKFHDQY